MHTKIFELVTSDSHSLLVGSLCTLGVATSISLVICEAQRRHGQHVKYSSACIYCGGSDITRKHVRVKLSPDLTGNWLTKHLSRMDYLCQTQVTCRNPQCKHKVEEDWRRLKFKEGEIRPLWYTLRLEVGANLPYAEKTDVRQWGIRSRLMRLQQLRETVTPDMLIFDANVDKILKERGFKPRVPKKRFQAKPPKPNIIVVNASEK